MKGQIKGAKTSNWPTTFQYFPLSRTISFNSLSCHPYFMPNPGFRSAGVTAAATLAILGSSSALLAWVYFILKLLNAPPNFRGQHLYELFPWTTLLIALVPPALIAVGLRLGVGLYQLRPWARLAALLWASIALLFCLGMIAFRPFETFFIPERFVSEFQSFQQLVALGFIMMLMPVSIWWLFFFRAKSVRLQFVPADTELPKQSTASFEKS